MLTLADRLLATILHQRLGLPQSALAALFAVRRETISRHIGQTRRLLQQAGYVHSARTAQYFQPGWADVRGGGAGQGDGQQIAAAPAARGRGEDDQRPV